MEFKDLILCVSVCLNVLQLTIGQGFLKGMLKDLFFRILFLTRIISVSADICSYTRSKTGKVSYSVELNIKTNLPYEISFDIIQIVVGSEKFPFEHAINLKKECKIKQYIDYNGEKSFSLILKTLNGILFEICPKVSFSTAAPKKAK